MSLAKIRLLNIVSKRDNLEAVLRRFITLTCIHPVLSDRIVGSTHGLTTMSTENPCQAIMNDLDKLEVEYGYPIPEFEGEPPFEGNVDTLKQNIQKIRDKLTEIGKEGEEVDALLKKYNDALTQVKNIESLDISLDDVFECDYVVARVGKLPNDSVDKLKYYNTKPFIFRAFTKEENVTWCMYFTSNAYEREVDNIFSSLLFERVFIPDFVHGTPETATQALSREIDGAKKQKEEVNGRLQALWNENAASLSQLKAQLAFLKQVYEARKYVVGLGNSFSINGFVGERTAAKVKEYMEELPGVEVFIRPADTDKRLKPPRRIRKNLCIKEKN